MSEKRETSASSESRPKKTSGKSKRAKSGIASGLAKGAAIFQNAKRYGALHDVLFHYVQDDHELAVESARLWLPEAEGLLAFDQLEVRSKEFFSKKLAKLAVDFIYLIPLLNGEGFVPLALILEHKAQSSLLDNSATLAQTMGYVAAYCQDLVKKRRNGTIKGTLLQPIPIVIYTGRDVELNGLNWEDSFQLPDQLAQYRIKFPLTFLNMTRLSQKKEFQASPFLRAAYNVMALASLGKLEGAESTALSALKGVDDWGERENDLFGAMTCYFLRSSINANIPVDQSTLETLLQSTNKGDKETMKSAWAEIAEELAKNEKKKIHEAGREKGREEGREEAREEAREGLRQAIDNVAASKFHKRSRRLNADVKRVSDFGQLNSILSYAAAQATSINDVIAYVGSLQ